MKKISSITLVLAFVLGACSNSGNATESAIAATTPPTLAVATETAGVPETNAATETTVPARNAVVTNLDHEVLARASFSKDFAPASIGLRFSPMVACKPGRTDISKSSCCLKERSYVQEPIRHLTFVK